MGGSSAGQRRFPDSDIRTELERILSSPVFEASQRNRQFLQYVVEETLAGRSDRIKAYSIATQVFGRGDDFDPLQDSIVRIEAARLRRELEHFYLKQGPGPLVQISIPKGTYVPDFLRPDTSGRAGDTQPANHPVAPQRLHHSAPRILVQTLDEDRHTDHFPALGNKITRQLIMSLTRYTELLVYAFPTSDAWSRLRGTDTAADLDIDYVLGGSVTVTEDKLYVDVLLQRNSDGRCIWASQHDYELSPDLSPGDIIGACQAIAGQVTLRIAERDGILDSQARDTMDEPPQSFDGFRKILDFHDYWRGLDPEMFEPLRLDLESTIAADPGFAMAFACLSMMYSNAARYDYDVGPTGQPPLDRALDLARRAIQLAPSSSRAYHARGIAEWFSGMTEESLETLGTALSLNPNDCEVMSELGLRRAMRLEWDLALPLLTESYRRNPLQPANYRMALFFYNFSLGQFEEALKEADATGAPGIAQVHIACSAALSRLGRMQEARERLRIADRILPDLRTRLTEDLTFRQINPDMVHDIVTAIGNVDPGWRPARARQAI